MPPFIETRSGREFWPLEPRKQDVDLYDIAHALSNQCRFSGHTMIHYSVAEHCVRVAELLRDWVPPSTDKRIICLWGLLHDASEAYLVDIPSPLKQDPRFAAYRAAEAAVMAAICDRFGLPREEPTWVGVADGVLLATEARDLMAYRPEHWNKLHQEPLPDLIVPWSHETARHNFLATFDRLTSSDTEPCSQ